MLSGFQGPGQQPPQGVYGSEASPVKASHLQVEADQAEARRRRHLEARILADELGHSLRQADVVPVQAHQRLRPMSESSATQHVHPAISLVR